MNNNLLSFLWSGLGFVFNKGGLLVLIGIVSYYLSLEGFSDFNIFIISLNVFAGVFGAALSLNGNRYASEHSNFYSIWLIDINFSLFSAIIYIIYESFTSIYWDSLILLKALVVFGTCYITSINGLFYAQGKFKNYAYINCSYGLGVLILGFFGVKFYGIVGLLIGMGFPGIIIFLISIYFVIKKFKSKIQFEIVKRSIKKVLMPNIFSGLLFQPAILIAANLIHEYSTPNGVIAYSLANQFRMIGGGVIVITGSVLMKQLVDNIKLKNKEIEKLNYTISYYPFLLIVLLLSFSSNFIISLFNNVDPEIFQFNFIILLLAALISAFKSAIARKFVSAENGKVSILSNLSWFIIFIILNVILIPKYGSKGASLGLLAANVFQVLLWSKYYVNKGYLQMTFFDIQFFISLFVLIISTLSIFYNMLLFPFISILIVGYFNILELKKMNKII